MEQKKIFMKRAGARGDSRLARVLTAIVMMFTLATTGAWADGITVNFPIGDGAYISWGGSMTKNGIKIQANSSKTLFYNNSPAQFEAYGENVTYTISMEDGSDIKGVNITLSGNNDMFQNSDGWTASGNTRTWTGNAKSVTFGINCKDNDEDDEWFSLFISAISVTLPPPAKYTVTVNDGTETPDWTIAPAEATTTGVEEGTKVTLKYSGDREVKSITAVVKATGPVTYTELKGGEVLHVGDILQVPNGEQWQIEGSTSPLMSDFNPYTVIRANINEGVTEAEDGAYYVIKAQPEVDYYFYIFYK